MGIALGSEVERPLTLAARREAWSAHHKDHAICEQWSSQNLVGTPSVQLVSRFELLGTHIAEMTVAACPIVEDIDIVGHAAVRQALQRGPLLGRWLETRRSAPSKL